MLAVSYSRFMVLALCISYLAVEATEHNLRRRKRYVAFPEGSSVAATICLTIGMVGNPNKDYISWAENWGVAYDLPSYKWAREHANGFPNATKAEVQRRSRRDLYEKMENVMQRLGFDGPACIRRALCESAQHLNSQRNKGNMIEEIVKTIFSFPAENPLPHEHSSVHYYDGIYRRARRQVANDCSAERINCHISLLDMAFGKYSMPATASKQSAGIMPYRAFM